MKSLWLVIAILIGGSVSVYAQDTILACTDTTGGVTYTNKDVKGCRTIDLPPLSVVPDRKATFSAVVEPQSVEPIISQELRLPSSSEFVCELYRDWIRMQLRTSGGFQYNSAEDSRLRLVYTTLFGSGYPPAGC